MEKTLLWGNLLYSCIPQGGKASILQVFRGEATAGEKLLYSTGYVLNKNLMTFVSVEKKV